MGRRSSPPLLALAAGACALLFVAVISSRDMSTSSILGLGRTARMSTTGFAAVNTPLMQRTMSPMCPSKLQRHQFVDTPRKYDTSVRVTDTAVQEVEAPTQTAQDDKDATAVLRFIRGSPHKYRRVVDTIRGRSYEEALAILQFMPYRACENVLKVVRSAAANAAHNQDMKKSKLYISDIWVDEGPIAYRFKYRAQGRVNRIRKPSSHIFVRVREREAEETGSKYFRRKRKGRKEVGPNWKGQYIEDPVEVVDSVEFEEDAVEEAAETVPVVEASSEEVPPAAE